MSLFQAWNPKPSRRRNSLPGKWTNHPASSKVCTSTIDRTGVEFLDREQFESRVHEFFRHPDELVMGRETAHQARDRFSNALTSITAEYPDQTIAVVAHGTVITLFVEKRTGLEPYQFWKKLDLPSFVVFSLPGYKLVTTIESVV